MRLDPIATATYLVTLAAPIAAYASFRRARRGDHDRHRLIQATLILLCWMSVFAIEIRIRLAGGSGALIQHAPAALLAWARGLLTVHIAVAVVTYALWTWLVVASWRRFEVILPGRFSRRHRALGTAVFGGLCFTAASASAVFVLAFVL